MEGNKQRSQNVDCYECGEKGHYARDCKTKQNKDGKGEKGLDPQTGNPRKGAQCTSASENAAGTTQEPAGSGRGLCQALCPVTVQLAGDKEGSVSISRSPKPSKEKGGGRVIRVEFSH